MSQNKFKFFSYKFFLRTVSLLTVTILFLSSPLSVLAGRPATTEEMEALVSQRQAMPIESNAIPNWPQGPAVVAESAILMDAHSGAILYAKNIHEHQYPASTTKILTSLIASEETELDEIVTFSHDAVFGIPRNSNHIAMNVGDTLTMEQCLDAILIRSANEVSYAVAEHISGSWDAFAVKMNERAKELGCVDSNFVNPNGLPDENHYSSAYDLARIGRAFFDNEMLCKTTLKPKLFIPKEDEDLTDWNKMGLLPGHKYAYEYTVGCKTGYTDDARYALVSCAEKNGMKLICVVLNDEMPYHYEDTISLYNYGFSNFDRINISQAETKYNINHAGSFYNGNDIFGNSTPILSLNKNDYIILPKTANFEDTISTISYDTVEEQQAAIINYSYQDIFIGSVSVDLTRNEEPSYTFDLITDDSASLEEKSSDSPSFVFVNILHIFLGILGIGTFLMILIGIRLFLKNYYITHKNTRGAWLRERRKNFTQLTRSLKPIQQRKIARSSKKRRPVHTTHMTTEKRNSRNNHTTKSRRNHHTTDHRRNSSSIYSSNSPKLRRKEESISARRRQAIRQAKRRQKAKHSHINFRDYD